MYQKHGRQKLTLWNSNDKLYPVDFQVFLKNIRGILTTLHYSKLIGSLTYSQPCKQNFLSFRDFYLLTYFCLNGVAKCFHKYVIYV